MSSSQEHSKHFRLSAGGLFGLAQRWIRGPGSSRARALTQIAIAVALLWLPLIVLSLFAGSLIGDRVDRPLMSDLVPHIRLLIAIPVLLLADFVIDPATRRAIGSLTASGLVPESAHNGFYQAEARMRRATESMWPDVVIIVLAFAFMWLFVPGYGGAALEGAFTSWAVNVDHGTLDPTPAGWWYLLISGPMFQVILFRWIWRFIVWGYFLFQVSRLPLTLHPTHPDGAGGLGYVGVAQQTFAVVFLAFSIVAASSVGHDILAEGATLLDVRLEIIVLVVVFVAIIHAPLTFFTGQLILARHAGLDAYGSLGYRLSEAFHDRWVREETSAKIGEELLASTDPSAMADYSATYDNVRSMRIVPATTRSLLTLAGVLVAPFLPLAFTEFSAQDLLQRVTDALV